MYKSAFVLYHCECCLLAFGFAGFVEFFAGVAFLSECYIVFDGVLLNWCFGFIGNVGFCLNGLIFGNLILRFC
jgi:hypothetical protein